ncbi:hypothetical protein BGZ81_006142 [Podila clonocystis]|nr:hypothetical protein BGZ81_006142 [Podila clonocystis]
MPTSLLLLLVVRRAIGALAALNFFLLTGGYIFYTNLLGYKNPFLVFQQVIVNLFLILAVVYALSPKRQARISASASLYDRNREWSRQRRALFTVILASITLIYVSIALNRLISSSPSNDDPTPGNSNGGEGFQGCGAYGRLKWVCVAQFIICAIELVCVVLLGVEGFFTYREHALREQKEREEELEEQRLQDLPPIVVQYQPDMSLPARARTRGEAVPGMEVEEEELPEYERHPKPHRGQPVVIVDMMHLEPANQEQGQQELGASRLPNYDTVVEMSEPVEETGNGAQATSAATAAAEEEEEVERISAPTEFILDPLSSSVVVVTPEELSTESGLSTPTTVSSSLSSTTAPETAQTPLPTFSPPSVPRLPSYTR